MSSIGEIIKQARKAQKIKQSSLAKGICSISYISKVENNLIIPKEDILLLLIKRLNLEFTDAPDEEDRLISAFSLLYKEGIVNREREQIKEALLKSYKQSVNFIQISNYYSYKLYYFRLLLIIEEYSPEIDELVTVLKSFENKLNPKQLFVYNLNLGIYYYLNKQYTKALSLLEKSLTFIHSFSLEDWELADFYNAISVSYLKTGNFFNAYVYSSKSLKYYKNLLVLNRIFDAYIVKGIALKNLMEFQEAEESFNQAQRLATSINLKSAKGIIFHNFGSLYAKQGLSDKAIENYELSLKHRNKNDDMGAMATILSIVLEFSKLENSVRVIKWCNKGLDILEKSKSDKEKTLCQSYYYHFNIYKAIHNSDKRLIKEVQSGIKYFEKIKDFRYIQKYSIKLGNYFFNQKKYKAASFYYQKSNIILFKQKSIKKLEDL